MHNCARTLVIFTKEPHAGRVKTRLGREIGMVAAAWWFRHTARRLIRILRRNSRWQTVVAVSPSNAVSAREYAGGYTLAQGRGNLGVSLRRIFQQFRYGPTVIIGTDCPTVRPHHIAQAFRALGSHDLVFGPAADGGYWLIGMKGGRALPRTALQNVRWSTHHALMDTVRSFAPATKVAYLETFSDIDTKQDLIHWMQENADR